MKKEKDFWESSRAFFLARLFFGALVCPFFDGGGHVGDGPVRSAINGAAVLGILEERGGGGVVTDFVSREHEAFERRRGGGGGGWVGFGDLHWEGVNSCGVGRVLGGVDVRCLCLAVRCWLGGAAKGGGWTGWGFRMSNTAMTGWQITSGQENDYGGT